MSCHDWPAMLAHRFDPDVAEPSGWGDAEAHLESCAECRRAALAIDPTLAFRSAAPWTPEADESAAILQAVRTLRRASELDGAARSAPRGSDSGPLAAAALFALVLALLPSATARNPADVVGSGGSAASRQQLRVSGPVAPAIEGVDRPDARVYEWGADDLSVVMVVDESLDV